MKKSEVSFLNVLFCLVVIFIHISSEPVTYLTAGSLEHAVMSTLSKLSGFVVQGFVLLSGMKMFLSSKNESYLCYIKSRCSKIILPYVFSAIVYYLFFCWCNYYEFSFGSLVPNIIRGDIAAHYYFVVIISQFYLLKIVWDKSLAYVPAALTVTVSTVITVAGIFWFGRFFGMYNDRVFTSYLIYWIVGCYIGKNYEKFMDGLCKKKVLVIAGFLLFAVLEAAFAYYKVLTHYWSAGLHIVYCFSAIFFCMVMARYCSEYFMKLKLFKLVNASSYYIYLWHLLVILAANQVLDKLGIADLGVRFFVRGTLAYFVSIFACGLYVEIKKRIRG